MKHNKISHWSTYWKGGLLTSLPQDFSENYNGAILDQWMLSFKKLYNGDAVLDLCTGNCAIALLMASFSLKNKLNLDITAVDASDITKSNILKKFPNQIYNLNKINLIPNTRVEDLNLKSNSFKLITSQYGIEYCNWESSAKLIEKLLSNDGEFVMMCHTGDTQVTSFMVKEKEQYDYLYLIGTFSTINKFAESSINYKRFIKLLINIQAKIVIRIENTESSLLHSILNIIKNIILMNEIKLKNNKQELINVSIQYENAYCRLLDLLAVTNSITNNPEWYNVFIKAGLKLKNKSIVMYNNTINSGTIFHFIK